MRKPTQKERKNLRERISGALAIPQDILLDLPRITVTSNQELEIENYKNILCYLDTTIELNCKDIVIKITGSKLEITTITDESICIKGIFSSISFIK